MGSQTVQQATEERHPVTVTVNRQPVTVEGPRTDGAAIKADAVAQGVKMQPDFVLSEELPNRRTRIIGDAEVVTVTPESHFVAVAPDDNS